MSTLTSDKFGLCLHKWLAVQRLCWIQESKLYISQPPLRNYREIHQTNWFIKRVFLFLRKQERVVSKSQNSSMSISINIRSFRSFRINIIITSKQILSLVGRSIGSIPSEMPFKDNIDISAQLQHTTLRHQYQYHQINNLSNLVNTTLPYGFENPFYQFFNVLCNL